MPEPSGRKEQRDYASQAVHQLKSNHGDPPHANIGDAFDRLAPRLIGPAQHNIRHGGCVRGYTRYLFNAGVESIYKEWLELPCNFQFVSSTSQEPQTCPSRIATSRVAILAVSSIYISTYCYIAAKSGSQITHNIS